MRQFIKGDCLAVLPTLPSQSVDLIFTDLPYGTLNCKWDVKLPLAQLWQQWKRLLRPRGAVLLFGQQPFSSELVFSNRRWFRYEWVWEKSNAVGFLNANKMPLRAHESVMVFYPNLPTYNPQKTAGKPYRSNGKRHGVYAGYSTSRKSATVNETGERHPRSVLKFASNKRTVHPTQKPAELCEYFIRTYTNEGATVLDCCMGSGTTGVAAGRSGRNFIGIERDPEFFLKAAGRISPMAAHYFSACRGRN
jgi:site-specific DNA-methyltransferase (adenine-specific)